MEENEYNKMNYSQDILKRFWSKIEIPVDWETNDQCWKWKASTWKGYGQFLLYENKKVRAHRFIYEYYYGPILDDLIIRHKCDNPSCCNPNHLITGTQIDNVNDMIERKRQNNVKGSENGNSVLTEEQVIEILENIKNGLYSTQLQISDDYFISKSVINKILNGYLWKSITDKYNLDELRKIFTHPNSQLTKEEVLEIRKLFLDGKNNIEIGKEFNVSPITISRIRTGKLYKNF